MCDHNSTELNLNSRLKPPADGDYETRDGAATIIAELADRLLMSQATVQAYRPLWMPYASGKIHEFVNRQIISLLSDMLDVGMISDSAADALEKLSKHG